MMTNIMMNSASKKDQKKAESGDPEKTTNYSKTQICIVTLAITIVFILAMLGKNFFGDKNPGYANIVVREDDVIVFERVHVDDVDKMASLKEEKIVAHGSPLSDEFIDDVNSRAFVWKAGRNFAKDTPMAYIKKLMGVKRDQSMKVVAQRMKVHKPTFVGGQVLPKDFDARTKWPHCESISEIRDQGGCGSCWAFGAVETMTDRQCIHKNESFRFSAENVLACCRRTCGDGCNGGYPWFAFAYWKTDGIVSGGAYGSHQGCSPYEVEPCEHHVSGNRSSCSSGVPTPHCRKNCDASYNSTYRRDLRFAKTIYEVTEEEEILQELVENGPVGATYEVYEDFLHYKSGVYHHVTGNFLGGHAIKVLGFGEENGVPYYLCANSWNYDWGDGGFFKIRRDQLDMGMTTGIPA